MVNETDTFRKETTMAVLQSHHVVTSKFDSQVTTWLTLAKVGKMEILTLLAEARNLHLLFG